VESRRRNERAKIPSTAQIECRIDLLRLPEERFLSGAKLGLGIGIVAIITGHRCVPRWLPSPTKSAFFPPDFSGPAGLAKTDFNSRLLIVTNS
jgi:hypothetical protein